MVAQPRYSFDMAIGTTRQRHLYLVQSESEQEVAETEGTGQIIQFDNERENRAVALRAMPLSEEAAVEMERILQDPEYPTHSGESLPSISAEELLKRLGH
jgi:hypothetical protein